MVFMKEKDKILNDYLEFKRLTIKTEKSLKIVKRYTSLFINYINKPLSKFEENDVVRYFNYLDENFSISSANDFKVMVKVFIKWHYPDWSSRFRNLDRLCKKKKAQPTYSEEDMLTKEDIEKLVQYEDEKRWKAYWLIFFFGCFRPKEACELKWEEIIFDGDEAFVSFIAGKNGKRFEKYLPSNAVFYLKKLQNNGSQYVFPTKRKHRNTTKRNQKKIKLEDKPMTRSGVYQHLRDISKEVFGRHINPYTIRHSIATILYNKDGLKDDDVAQQMGHSSDMKRVYSHPSRKLIREKMKKLYIKAEELPPKTKKDYEKRLKEVEAMLEHLVRNLPEEVKNFKIPDFPK